jgi:hypothetical protein
MASSRARGVEQGSGGKVAAEAWSLGLQVGRRLRGRWLALAVLLRKVPSALLLQTGLDTDSLAPAWVVVEDRATGRAVGRVGCGRMVGAAERLLASMQTDAETMDTDEFRARWSL